MQTSTSIGIGHGGQSSPAQPGRAFASTSVAVFCGNLGADGLTARRMKLTTKPGTRLRIASVLLQSRFTVQFLLQRRTGPVSLEMLDFELGRAVIVKAIAAFAIRSSEHIEELAYGVLISIGLGFNHPWAVHLFFLLTSGMKNVLKCSTSFRAGVP